jgi:N-acetylmuramoyl-L-alanine amidase
MRALAAALCLVAAGCASGGPAGAPRAGPPAPLPLPAESLRIVVAYPGPTEVLEAHDSAFIYGAVTRGATLTVNGASVPVSPGGGWIAWVPLPDDTTAYFRLVAGAAADSQVVIFRARIAPRFHPPADRAAWIDTLSFSPRGRLTLPPGEGIRLSVRAAAGATLLLRPPRGPAVALVPDSSPDDPSWGARAFARDTAALHGVESPTARRYVGWLPADWLCAEAPGCATLEVAAGGGADTARVPWPLSVRLLDSARPTVVVLNDDTAHTGTTDSLTVGKAVPGGTYNWFFPTGTRAVESGRWNDQIRLQLSRAAVAWVNAADVIPLAPGTPPPGGTVGSVRLYSGAASVTLRVPLPARVPYQIAEEDRALTLRLYGVGSDINWMQYGAGAGAADPLVTRLSYAQPAADEVTIRIELARAVWGYRSRFDGRDLLLEIRRPPDIDRDRPLRGRTIVLDPGHPPVGATGPTGLWEPVPTLAVARKAQTLLERAGATVLLTRTDSLPVDLYPRTRFAERHDADVLVSIHLNALPDGVNPFVNNGTSVYYFQPRAVELARRLDAALVAELGLRDLGIGRGDYALVRPTWMPAALTEAAFIMMPDQEELVRGEEGQWRYARGLARGIEEFLRAAGRR